MEERRPQLFRGSLDPFWHRNPSSLMGIRRIRQMTLFEELKRRKVLKVGGAYLVVAWLAVQVASIAFPAFDSSPRLLRLCILFAALGFPVALALAWVIDVTPQGLK